MTEVFNVIEEEFKSDIDFVSNNIILRNTKNDNLNERSYTLTMNLVTSNLYLKKVDSKTITFKFEVFGYTFIDNVTVGNNNGMDISKFIRKFYFRLLKGNLHDILIFINSLSDTINKKEYHELFSVSKKYFNEFSYKLIGHTEKNELPRIMYSKSVYLPKNRGTRESVELVKICDLHGNSVGVTFTTNFEQMIVPYIYEDKKTVTKLKPFKLNKESNKLNILEIIQESKSMLGIK